MIRTCVSKVELGICSLLTKRRLEYSVTMVYAQILINERAAPMIAYKWNVGSAAEASGFKQLSGKIGIIPTTAHSAIVIAAIAPKT